jgi:hypothetical protein
MPVFMIKTLTFLTSNKNCLIFLSYYNEESTVLEVDPLALCPTPLEVSRKCRSRHDPWGSGSTGPSYLQCVQLRLNLFNNEHRQFLYA